MEIPLRGDHAHQRLLHHQAGSSSSAELLGIGQRHRFAKCLLSSRPLLVLGLVQHVPRLLHCGPSLLVQTLAKCAAGIALANLKHCLFVHRELVFRLMKPALN